MPHENPFDLISSMKSIKDVFDPLGTHFAISGQEAKNGTNQATLENVAKDVARGTYHIVFPTDLQRKNESLLEYLAEKLPKLGIKYSFDNIPSCITESKNTITLELNKLLDMVSNNRSLDAAAGASVLNEVCNYFSNIRNFENTFKYTFFQVGMPSIAKFAGIYNGPGAFVHVPYVSRMIIEENRIVGECFLSVAAIRLAISPEGRINLLSNENEPNVILMSRVIYCGTPVQSEIAVFYNEVSNASFEITYNGRLILSEQTIKTAGISNVLTQKLIFDLGCYVLTMRKFQALILSCLHDIVYGQLDTAHQKMNSEEYEEYEFFSIKKVISLMIACLNIKVPNMESWEPGWLRSVMPRLWEHELITPELKSLLKLYDILNSLLSSKPFNNVKEFNSLSSIQKYIQNHFSKLPSETIGILRELQIFLRSQITIETVGFFPQLEIFLKGHNIGVPNFFMVEFGGFIKELNLSDVNPNMQAESTDKPQGKSSPQPDASSGLSSIYFN